MLIYSGEFNTLPYFVFVQTKSERAEQDGKSDGDDDSEDPGAESELSIWIMNDWRISRTVWASKAETNWCKFNENRSNTDVYNKPRQCYHRWTDVFPPLFSLFHLMTVSLWIQNVFCLTSCQSGKISGDQQPHEVNIVTSVSVQCIRWLLNRTDVSQDSSLQFSYRKPGEKTKQKKVLCLKLPRFLYSLLNIYFFNWNHTLMSCHNRVVSRNFQVAFP